MNARSVAAFTGWDVLIVLSTAFLLLALVVLAQHPGRCGARSGRIQCVSNQKQVALAFRMWSNDNGEKFPMEVSGKNGGAMETALAGSVIQTFTVVSNELNSPKILLCPEDTKRGPQALIFYGLNAKNLSYSFGMDATETNAAAILVADRNIVLADGKQPQGLLTITDPKSALWSPEIHKHQGNIALADGSASQVTQDGLRKALRDSGLATNRFAVP